jgi:hypothetical protein
MSQTQGGGKPIVKDLETKQPVGPKGINDPKEPGIHGTNHGNNGTQGSR